MAGTLGHSPAQVVAQLLVDMGYGVTPDVRTPTAWASHYGSEPALPDEVLTTRLTGGLSEGTTQFDGVDQERYALQVRVRSMNEDSGWVKANAITVGLHAVNNRLVNVDGTQYLVSTIESRGKVQSLSKGDPASSLSIHVSNFMAQIDQVS